ncbi:PEP-CTERM sorting domain-containing protein [Verrucomicrobiaceae bacterium N1E253]|uniref:PEP-CTERM sorting domain-containing protein n=1 Tax=Oceaniferula marina TaxID=2748318 RepID=A0A851GIL2_9BACT|nr:PEP-CTERM sorting domain-containing protein [Oceaniferula marina]NWK55045.1 PEP-CTERM sorting domain-containing protein [Oceaniferula marina]
MMKYPSILLGSLLSIGSASAANVIVNGSFENTTVAITPQAGTAWGDRAAAAGLTGWTLESNNGLALANGGTAPFHTGNGSNVPFQTPTDGNTFLTTNADATSIFSQTINGLSAGTVNVSFDLNRMLAAGSGTFTANVEVFDGNSDAATSLWSETVDVAAQTQETWVNTASGTFANSGSELFVRVTLVDQVNGGQIGMDNLVINHTAVPEPSSAALLGLGGLALILRRRK